MSTRPDFRRTAPALPKSRQRSRLWSALPKPYRILLLASIISVGGLIFYLTRPVRLQFVGFLPDYPQGTLVEWHQDLARDSARWRTTDSSNEIQAFYRAQAKCIATAPSPALSVLHCVTRTETTGAVITTIATVTISTRNPDQRFVLVEQEQRSRGKERWP